MDRTALTHTLKPLERDGLIELKQDPDDGRTRRIHVTARGKRRHDAAAGQWRKAQQAFTAAVGEDEVASLRALLRLVTQAELGNRT